MSGVTDRLRRAMEMAAADPDGVTALPKGGWLVRSQSGPGSYHIRLLGGDYVCNCKDFQDSWGEPCKHVFRLYLHLFPNGELAGTRPARVPEKARPKRDWHIYDQAKQNEIQVIEVLARGLADTIEEPHFTPRGRGRPPHSLADQLFCTLIRLYEGWECRESKGAFRRAAQTGLLRDVPGYAITSRFLCREDLTPILEKFVTRAALPMAPIEKLFAADSTGIQTRSFGAWRETSHGERRERVWLKAHALAGTRTHCIARLLVTERDVSDYREFEPLVRGTIEEGFRIGELFTDMGYSGRSNHNLAGELGFNFYHRFKSTDTPHPTSKTLDAMGRRVSSRLWQEAFYFFRDHREEWAAKYNPNRPQIETVWSSWKTQFGETLASKKLVSRVNEILCLGVVYNLMIITKAIFQYGITPWYLPEGSDRWLAGLGIPSSVSDHSPEDP